MMELLRQGYFGDEDNLVFVPHRRRRRPVRHGPAPLSTRRFGRTIPLKEHH